MKLYDNEETNKIKNNKTVYSSFDNAIDGIVESVHTERNMKIHIFFALVILALSFFLDFSRIELIIISFTIALVIAAELINTAMETLADIVSESKFNPITKKVKDISAGAVLIMTINSLFVAYLLVYPKVKRIFITKSVIQKVMHSQEHLAIISIVSVTLVVLLVKGFFYKQNTTFLVGGFVSGHSALAFNIATILSIIIKVLPVQIAFYIIAILIAYSRVKEKFHTVREVILGAILGIYFGVLFFIKYL